MNPFETARPPEQPEHRLEARAFKVGDLLQDIQRDRLRIPSLQSRSAEGDVDARELMDNLYRGYPVGTLLLWASSDQPDILPGCDQPRGCRPRRARRGPAVVRIRLRRLRRRVSETSTLDVFSVYGRDSCSSGFRCHDI